MGELTAQLCRLLPPNAHDLCNGRLIVQLSSLADIKPKCKFVTEFGDRKELIDALKAAAYVPVYHETVTRVGGALAADGALTSSAPVAPWLLQRTLVVHWSTSVSMDGLRLESVRRAKGTPMQRVIGDRTWLTRRTW